ncbi:cytochrome c6 PetJ [Nostoc sp. C117]|uniref:cytochrome c6 PetJ n=1 Tax=Nostoc sp. C117 TaxID=3349875 RepID=UPI00370D5C7E
MEKILTLVLVTFVLLISTFTLPAIASDTVNGEQIFSNYCAGCHMNGGNIVRRGKNLQKQALNKYGMNSIEAVISIVTNGKSNMSAYKDRLSEQQIQHVATYVIEQAEKDWR